ncbi:MAG: malto-oligosyltrehalose synthase [Methylacidiphilales bacterium]|nr:malto-oligosyltrehalose synthase [Candidatus Methylacidiphilales bacterium]
MLSLPTTLPRATYRFQFTPQFGFAAAEKLVPYLSGLGISDLYASPILQASSTSTHGYDVNDYNRVSTTLGGREALDRLSAELRKRELGLLVDFVPNHMGIDGEYNVWWRHVLENGSNSKYARYFDIEWHPRLERLHDRVLVPMLGDHYGTVLENGGLVLKQFQGRFFVHYGSLKLPIRPRSYGLIFEQMIELLPSGDVRRRKLQESAEAFENLPTDNPEARDAALEKLLEEWAEALASDTMLSQTLQQALGKMNGVRGDSASFMKLHELLEQQHYRLAHWKVGAHEVNYRRFFAIDTLVGLKMEDPEVFAATHRLLGDLLAAGTVTGIRLDHIDGLWNPAQYLERLRNLIAERRADDVAIYTLVEKILTVGETLPESWAVHGTTGYEFASSLIDLFLDQKDEPAWTRIYNDFTGEAETSHDLTYQDKLFILQEIFPNAVASLAAELDALIEPDWHWRDVSLHDIERALRHLLACLPIYRTYRMPGEKISATDKKWLTVARDEALRRNPDFDPVPLRFLVRVLSGEYPGAEEGPERKSAFDAWTCKLQQVTGAIMAKSVEDTHFYRFGRMLATNEVGHHPSLFGRPVSEFHEANWRRFRQVPLCLLATSTHDTKWSEDARARLCALAELPCEWESHLRTWHKMNLGARREIHGRMAPDGREEYFLYQALLASWPLGNGGSYDVYRERIKGYFRKAQAEAKLDTNWINPRVEWQQAGEAFIDMIFASTPFLEDFMPFARRIASRGMIFSLAQTVLKATSPGVPDFYQGTEVWDFSLVDPDNRRPVDYVYRTTLLDGLAKRGAKELLENWKDGGIKMRITRALLSLRRDQPELFALGDYQALHLAGPKADQVVAFSRRWRTAELLVIVPRRLDLIEAPGIGKAWSGTHLPIHKSRQWMNMLTGQAFAEDAGDITMETLFADWPVAVLFSAS